MAVTKTNEYPFVDLANGPSIFDGANGNVKTGRKPTEEEVQDALDWAEGFQARHSELFDRLAKE